MKKSKRKKPTRKSAAKVEGSAEKRNAVRSEAAGTGTTPASSPANKGAAVTQSGGAASSPRREAQNNGAANSPKAGATSSDPRSNETGDKPAVSEDLRSKFPADFPFWARYKKGDHPTLVVGEEDCQDHGKTELGFVHREVTHTIGRGERIVPNPDPRDKKPMILKRPKVDPIRMFAPSTKKFNMPSSLKDRYQKTKK